MPKASTTALQDAIRHMHGCESSFVEAVSIHETFEGVTVGEGDVQVLTSSPIPRFREPMRGVTRRTMAERASGWCSTVRLSIRR
jgi:hypothetical protein